MIKRYFIFAFLSLFMLQGVTTDVYAQKKKKKEDVIVMAQFKGGQEALIDYLLQHTRYPAEAMKEEITGEVVVEFVVERNGMITNAKIVKSVAPSLDQEALRVVRNMPNWEPGTKNGLRMRSQLTIPINFKVIREHGKYVDPETMDDGIQKKSKKKRKLKRKGMGKEF
ncbi:MAG: energy transducer TonB [Bacteroidales bacterium]|nr:energy transducer TonB [Bacteroidales bacterium]